MGIEPTLFAWEARVLPLDDTRQGAGIVSVWASALVLEGRCSGVCEVRLVLAVVS